MEWAKRYTRANAGVYYAMCKVLDLGTMPAMDDRWRGKAWNALNYCFGALEKAEGEDPWKVNEELVARMRALKDTVSHNGVTVLRENTYSAQGGVLVDDMPNSVKEHGRWTNLSVSDRERATVEGVAKAYAWIVGHYAWRYADEGQGCCVCMKDMDTVYRCSRTRGFPFQVLMAGGTKRLYYTLTMWEG